jgi:hypothetical protein
MLKKVKIHKFQKIISTFISLTCNMCDVPLGHMLTKNLKCGFC